MPAPPLLGLSSGMDTQNTIQQLLRLEMIPIQRLQEDNRRLNFQIDAWDKLHVQTRKLGDKSRALYSFAGPFARKIVNSSDPGAITGEASANVDTGLQQIEVLKLATKHQLHSDPLPIDTPLPSANFTIKNGEKHLFLSRRQTIRPRPPPPVQGRL